MTVRSKRVSFILSVATSSRPVSERRGGSARASALTTARASMPRTSARAGVTPPEYTRLLISLPPRDQRTENALTPRQRRLHPLRPEGHRAQAHARRVKDRVAERGGHRRG